LLDSSAKRVEHVEEVREGHVNVFCAGHRRFAVGDEAGDGQRHDDAVVRTAFHGCADEVAVSAVNEQFVLVFFDLRAHLREFLGHRAHAVSLLVPDVLSVGNPGDAVGSGPKRRDGRQEVRRVFDADLDASQFGL